MEDTVQGLSTMEGLAASATVKGHWTIQPRWEGAAPRCWILAIGELADVEGWLLTDSVRRLRKAG